MISQRLLGTTEVAVFHHTDCGMLTFTNDDIRQKVKAEETGNAVVSEAIDKIDFLTFPNLKESVQDDIHYLKGTKLLKEGTHLSGWIYDVTTGKVCDSCNLMITKERSLMQRISSDHSCNRTRNFVMTITMYLYFEKGVHNVLGSSSKPLYLDE